MTKLAGAIIALVAGIMPYVTSGAEEHPCDLPDILPAPSYTHFVYLPIVGWASSFNARIMDNHTCYVTGEGGLHIVGEVYNHTPAPINSVEVIADIYNNNGVLVGTGFSYVVLNNIPPGDTACFNISLQEPNNWANYKLSGTYYPNGSPPLNLSPLNDVGQLEPDGDYRIQGLVRNDEAVEVDSVQPIFTLYDAEDRVLDCGSTFTTITKLGRGLTSSFDKTFSDRDDYSVVNSYRIQVDGSAASATTAQFYQLPVRLY